MDSVLPLDSEVSAGRACCRIAMATLMQRRIEARMLMAWLQANRRVASPLGELLWRRKGGGERNERVVDMFEGGKTLKRSDSTEKRVN